MLTVFKDKKKFGNKVFYFFSGRRYPGRPAGATITGLFYWKHFTKKRIMVDSYHFNK